MPREVGAGASPGGRASGTPAGEDGLIAAGHWRGFRAVVAMLEYMRAGG